MAESSMKFPKEPRPNVRRGERSRASGRSRMKDESFDSLHYVISFRPWGVNPNHMHVLKHSGVGSRKSRRVW
ncbi:hypothetical protein M407DRAFT_121855 [Tulasnella calospora MUT 4182]|uniref:Uncharacterized protein n=1 Tax=Tulasnella calospora MUT 4182 TaxID=1051891 RepID=A0A0C3QU57_9AGAM|nr:hypothetical protein M407DRAFT_121855 [Tulasnella calospora MUT 4182]